MHCHSDVGLTLAVPVEVIDWDHQGLICKVTLNPPTQPQDLSSVLFQLAHKGKVKRLQSLVTQCLVTNDNSTSSTSVSKSAAALYLLASTADLHGRRLLHVACQHGRVKMVRYLVDVGLPIEVYDRNGNTPVHSCIKYGLKHHRYSKCCKLLACLMESNLELLYVRNNMGTSPSSLLERLWLLVSPDQRTKGDAILMQCSLKDDLFGKVAPPKRRYNDAISEDAWRERLLDEVSADFPRHEEYFQGFSDIGTSSGDLFEDIGKEYEQKKRRRVYISRPESSQHSASNTYKKASTSDGEFRHRHAEELRRLGLVSPTSNSDVSVIPYEQYSERWQTFLRSGTSGTIPWPPLKVGDMEELLRFVGRSLLHLRQLQVDWHPDRFFSRLPSGVQRTEDLANRVTALSQFFNKAVAELRSYVENSKH